MKVGLTVEVKLGVLVDVDVEVWVGVWVEVAVKLGDIEFVSVGVCVPV